MNLIRSAVAVLLISLSALADGTTITLTAKDNGTSVLVSPGQIVAVELESNRTTGYTWKVDSVDKAILSLTSEFYMKPADAGQRVGAGGVAIYAFKAEKPGRTVLKLVYIRPWEKHVTPMGRNVFQVLVVVGKGR